MEFQETPRTSLSTYTSWSDQKGQKISRFRVCDDPMESRFELHEKAPDHSKLQSLDTSCESFKFQEFL